MDELPHPDSEELRRLVPDARARAVYRLLYDNRGNPLSMLEIRERLSGELPEQEQLDRRKRDLHPYFVIGRIREGKTYKYELVGRKPESGPRSGISLRLRAEVLSEGRCRSCGRWPREDDVKLVVDHVIPQTWGGTDERENLQPLCEDCNQGKKDLFSDFDEHADRLRTAIHHDEPHRRIGELLKAFGGDWVPSDLIGVVASAGQYQEDWQKRTRELRTLGWKIEVQRKRGGGRVRTFYRVSHWEPWPKGSIRAEIARRERTSGH